MLTAFGAATQRDPDRRLRHVRRRRWSTASAARASRARSPASSMRAFDVVWGAVNGRGGHREQLRRRQGRRRRLRRLGDPRRRPVLARLPAARRRRGDQRAHPHHPTAGGRSAPRLRLDDYDVDGLLSGEFHVFGDYLAPVRLRHDDDRRRASPTASRSRRRRASVRLEGDGVRLDSIQIAKGERPRHRRRLRRLERHLLVQLRRPRHSRRDASSLAKTSVGAALGPARLHRRRQRHVRRAALRRARHDPRLLRRRRRHRRRWSARSASTAT